MGRIQGLFETGLITENRLIKAAPGEVHSITLAWTGATAGDRCYLRDGLDGAAAVEVTFILGAANGTLHKEWPQGKKFDTAIYFDQGSIASNELFAEMTCK